MKERELFNLDVEDTLMALAIANGSIATSEQFVPELFTAERRSLAAALSRAWMMKEPVTATTLQLHGCSDEGLDAFNFVEDKFKKGKPQGERADSLFKSLRELACLRHVEAAARGLHHEVVYGEEAPQGILERLQKGCSEAELILDSSVGDLSDGSNVNDLLNLIIKRAENPGRIDGLKTGFSRLDLMMNGLQPGRLVIIGARPHIGKTGLGCSIATNMLLDGKRCAYFTLEQSAVELKELVAQNISGVSANAHLQKGGYTKRELNSLRDAAERMQEFKWRIDDNGRIDLRSFKAKVRAIKRDHGLDAVFVDYIQLMRGDERRKSDRHLEVGEISGSLKALAKELQIRVIAMSQIRRQDTRFDRDKQRQVSPRPTMDGLKESGDLEQDADIILLLHRDLEEKPATGQSETRATAILAKNRQTGKLGDIRLLFNHTTAGFREDSIQ